MMAILASNQTDTGAIAMPLQAQEHVQSQADVVALGVGGADLGALHVVELLDAAMVVCSMV